MKVFSMNNAYECALLKDQYPNVTFIETNRTMQQLYGKPLVSISAVLDWCKEYKGDHFCIINSDIELKTDTDTIERIKAKMQAAIVLVNRVDYDKDYSGNKYLQGIDVFFIHRNFLYIYPQSLHCFGMTFWDYEIPYTASQSGVEVVFLKQNIAYHKVHTAQYTQDHWYKSGRHFIWLHTLYQFNEKTEIGKMSTYIFNYIYNYSKRIEI